MKKTVMILAVLTLLLLTSCAQAQKIICPDNTPISFAQETLPITGGVSANVTTPEDSSTTGQDVVQPPLLPPSDSSVPSNETPKSDIVTPPPSNIKTYTEGDIVQLSPTITDPDGDKITLTYSKPLNSTGGWQTMVGDAGDYNVTIIADDGSNKVEKVVPISIIARNRPPVITLLQDTITVREGETVRIDANFSDPEGKSVTVSYSGWMSMEVKSTDYKDAGNYIVTLTASDGEMFSVKNVTVIVKDVNRPPTISSLQGIVVIEEELVKLSPVVQDPDGDNVTVTYENPFDSLGVWQTKKGDAGTYNTNIKVSDGVLDSSASLTVTVKQRNQPPIITVSDITVKEGEVVNLNPDVIDPEGDKTNITYSGWMNSDTKNTTYDDAGTYEVIITADDGQNKASKKVTITVQNVNRPPVFNI